MIGTNKFQKDFKKTWKMKAIQLIITFSLAVTMMCTAQNVGIGISSPLYKLDVAGMVRNSNIGISSPGLFGRLTSGGSLRIENSNDNRFLIVDGSSIQSQIASTLSSGTTASPLLINPYGGNVGIRTFTPNASLSVFRGTGVDGTAAFFGTDHVSHFNYNIDENTYIRGGKTGSAVYLNDTHYGDVNIATGGGNINTGNAVYSAQTGGLNIVPVGIVKYRIKFGSSGNITEASINNEAGNIAAGTYSATAGTYTDDAVTIDIDLNNTICNQYSKVVAIGANGFNNRNFGEGRACNTSLSNIIQANGISILRIIYGADSFALVDPVLYGTFILYGIK
jgi:hypothetical protein